MKKLIITAGDLWSDIDILACALAYEQLLRLEGKDARAVLSAPLNLTVTKDIRDLGLDFEQEFHYDNNKVEFIVVDISLPQYYAKFVDLNKVVEVFDHHFYDELGDLKARLGNSCHIEKVGACATLIWEEFQKRGFSKQISPLNALLIYTAIISNTLNFKAGVTTDRDIKASEELIKIANPPHDWKQRYYEQIEESIMKDPIANMQLDTKIIDLKSGSIAITQIELWDSSRFFESNSEILDNFLYSQDTKFAFITSPSINKGVNYLYALNSQSEELLKSIWPELEFKNKITQTKKLYLRKEILPLLLNF
jgi:inorganic pyrophosphatase/manganese-dependent inorganic pyrophosphatase